MKRVSLSIRSSLLPFIILATSTPSFTPLPRILVACSVHIIIFNILSSTWLSTIGTRNHSLVPNFHPRGLLSISVSNTIQSDPYFIALSELSCFLSRLTHELTSASAIYHVLFRDAMEMWLVPFSPLMPMRCNVMA
ncbi:hypothetical protein BDN72DRAFT_632415 [Pluteus cervinus]|uniref:Uncharacterized protein n=1 Tax=Pluteus cervinus TaxID=181527 RepID=A0ACD3BCS7_9AGAR|nr:hypothetical protein BDN72DRAFT_632415 [Pluteus cervinus]